MGRKLPEDPTKRRLQIYKRLYQHMPHWYELMCSGDMEDIITTIDGEEVFYYDLLIGLDFLPPRQRQAFELICLQGYTESAATKEMLPNSKWSTPIQQYSDMALARMVAAYDQKQAGTWNPAAQKRKRTGKPKCSDPPQKAE